jgi:hypothetical protein
MSTASAMDTNTLQILENIQPLKGEVVHIKTVQETRPNEEYGGYLSSSADLTDRKCTSRKSWIADVTCVDF